MQRHLSSFVRLKNKKISKLLFFVFFRRVFLFFVEKLCFQNNFDEKSFVESNWFVRSLIDERMSHRFFYFLQRRKIFLLRSCLTILTSLRIFIDVVFLFQKRKSPKFFSFIRRKSTFQMDSSGENTNSSVKFSSKTRSFRLFVVVVVVLEHRSNTGNV